MTFYCDNKRHLVCVPYSVEALHEMAASLGIKRCWFHAGDKPHYDIPKTRIAGITAKCQLVSAREILAIIQNKQTRAAAMPALTTDTNEARLHALRLQGVKQQLIGLFNAHEVSYEEKKAAKAYLKTIADDLPRLTCWERNVRAELERRHTQAKQREAGLRGVLRQPCPDCGASPGYNPDTCTACYAAAAQAA